MKKNKGFTLIELLVVIAIIGLLATLAVISLGTARRDSRDSKRQADIRTLQSAIELYINDLGAPPTIAETVDWDGLSGNLADYLASDAPAPPAGGSLTDCVADISEDWAGQECYFYCQDAGDSDYLLGATLESDDDISGDVDAVVAGYIAGECIGVNDSGLHIEDAGNVVDTCVDLPTTAPSVFCLGTAVAT